MNASPQDLCGRDLLPQFSTSRDFALDCDAADILAPYRKQFELPREFQRPAAHLSMRSFARAWRRAPRSTT